MALNEVYVDSSIAGDSGTGASGTPYGDLEYALEQTTPNANGDRFNIKAGTDEVLEFALDIVTDYGTPTLAAPLVFQGYTSTAGDGGIGGISGGGSVSIVDLTSLDFVSFVDMHLHNSGSNKLINLDQDCHLIRCEIDNSSNTGNTVEVGSRSNIVSCHIHNIAGRVQIQGGFVGFNYFENGTNTFVDTIRAGGGATIYRNIIHLSTASNSSNGINMTSVGLKILNNSIWSDAGTGAGITFDASNASSICINNVIEGFSGTGGKGIEFNGSEVLAVYDNNAVENCATEYDTVALAIADLGSTNESLSASPFTSASTGDFNPVDTGGIKEGSLPDDFAGQ